MEITQLNYFRVVAQLENMTSAASVLNVTQPTLSSSINLLEKELGVLLFDRRNGKLLLSTTGKVFYESLDKVFFDLDIAIERAKSTYAKDEGSTYVGISYNGIISTAISDFVKLHPNVHFFETTQVDENAIRLLETGALDLLVSNYDISSSKAERYAIFDDGLVALASPFSPVSKMEKIEMDDLLRIKVVFLGQIGGIYSLIHSKENGAIYNKSKIDILYEGADEDTAIKLASDNFGVLVMPHSTYLWKIATFPDRYKGLIPVMFDDKISKSTIYVARAKNKELRPLPSEFFEYLIDYYKGSIEK